MRTIKDYLNNRLSPREEELITRQLFRERFGDSPSLRKQRWAQKLEQDHGVHRSNGKPQSDGKLRRLYLGLLLAAGIAALIFFWFSGREVLSFEEQLQAYVTDYHNESNSRKNMVLGKEEQEALAREAYNEQRFTDAVTQWSGLATIHPEEAGYQFFWALSLMYQQEADYDQAIKLLMAVMQNSNRWEEEARWYLSLCLLKAGQHERGQRELMHIVEHTAWNYQEAIVLLRQLEEQLKQMD